MKFTCIEKKLDNIHYELNGTVRGGYKVWFSSYDGDLSIRVSKQEFDTYVIGEEYNFMFIEDN